MARLRGCAKFASVFVGFLSLSGCLSGGGVTGSDASSSQSSLDAGLPIGAAVPVGAQLSVPAYSGSSDTVSIPDITETDFRITTFTN